MKTCNTLRALFLLVALSFSAGTFAASPAIESIVNHEYTIYSDAQLIFVPRKSENGEKEKEAKKEASEETSVEANKEIPAVESAPALMLDAVSGATNPLKGGEERKELSKVRTANTTQNVEELFWLRKKARPDVKFSPFPMVM